MIRLAIRGLRPGRAVLTGLAVAVGVAVVSGTLMIREAAQRTGTADAELELISRIMLIAGAVAVLVGAFIVNLSTSVTVARRIRELALVRCLGAQRRQIRRWMLLESLAIGIVATAIGLGLGLGVGQILKALINDDRFPGHLGDVAIVPGPLTLIASLAVGCVATVVSTVAPARRAGRVPPMVALRDLPLGPARPVRSWLGAVFALLAVGAIWVAVASGTGPLLVGAAALALLAVRRMPPSFARAVGAPLGRTGVSGWLGWQNSTREPLRTAANVSAMVIGIGLLAFVGVLTASTRSAMLDEHARNLAEYQVDGQITPPLVARLQARPELAAVLWEQCTTRALGESDVCAVDPATLPKVASLQVIAGRLADLGPGGIAVERGDAAANGWSVGSPIGVRLPGGSRQLTVVAVYRSAYLFRSPLMSTADYQALGGPPQGCCVSIRSAGSPAAARAAIDAAIGSADGVVVRDRAELRAEDLAQIDGATWVYRALTGLAALIGLAGTANVLGLSIVERRRELGMLRAAGLERRGLRAMVRVEALITAVLAVVVGTAIGVGLGWAAVAILGRSSVPMTFSVPYETLAATALLVAVVGAVFSGIPARLAGRVSVVEAIGSA